MNTYYIPNTNVEAQVIDPPTGSDYVSLFLHAGEKGNGLDVGSVNAGTSNGSYVFAVGLGGINGSFKRALVKAGQTTDDYQQIHQNLYNVAGKRLTASESKFSNDDPVQFSLMLKPDPSFNLPKYDGIVFIDVFNSKQLPHSNSLNSSMIYLVPPDHTNYSDQASFFKAIEASCITIVKALDIYNTKHATPGNVLNLKAIKNIRMCLFSGGIYRGSAEQDDVASHNLAGLEQGISSLGPKQDSIVKIDFENSYDQSTRQNVFRVIQGKLTNKSKIGY